MSSRSETSRIDSKYLPDSLKWMLVVAGVLIAIGALNVYSATYYMNMEAGGNPYKHLIRHVGYLAGSLGLGAVCARVSKNWIRKWTWVWTTFIVLLLLLVIVAGATVNGATRWIMLGPISVQPSEFAKVAAILWAASFLAKRVDRHERISLLFFKVTQRDKKTGRKKRHFIKGFLKQYLPLYGPLLMAGIVLKQPDMGTAVLILLFPLLLYVLSGLSWFEMFLGVIGAVAGGILLVLLEPYRIARVKILLDPFPYARDDGYQTVQSLIAVGSGGFFGQSGGEGMAKFLYLPEQFTDFAFAVFSQEFGFVGAFFLVLLYMTFLLTGFLTASKLNETYAALVVYGLTLLITVQGVINIAMVVGCFPVTGVPLPFISYGGSSLMTNIIALGLIYGTTLQSLRETDLEERRRRIDAMEGRAASFQDLSHSVYR